MRDERPMNEAAIQALVEGRHGDPFPLLGNDRFFLIKARREIVPPPGGVEVSFLLARLRARERLVSVDV
jgi:hypothetical protein